MPDTAPTPASPTVRHLRQVLLWPLRLLQQGGGHGRPPWQVMRDLGDASPWREQCEPILPCRTSGWCS
jgi:hypothetical protein